MPPIWWVDTAILTRAVKATYGSSMTSNYTWSFITATANHPSKIS